MRGQVNGGQMAASLVAFWRVAVEAIWCQVLISIRGHEDDPNLISTVDTTFRQAIVTLPLKSH